MENLNKFLENISEAEDALNVAELYMKKVEDLRLNFLLRNLKRFIKTYMIIQKLIILMPGKMYVLYV